ncbi:hypothetical protein HYH03_016364 [Edaphochlamys debaryana]|uniref:Uncharacterized protein n=1 Tax=Edaphochlamys debaryana TaxID=47281 RepID=A0A835XPZ1_9CHLO|nr:hypothetical protein HYH03_016364 [Edaphochlamys debaryana]|eukprot:KAG2484880.1 hypothetical protein HYH03_016364 [Edaphochlamys debaryana]
MLGLVASFLDPNQVAWSFVLVNKAAVVAAACGDHGQRAPRTIRLGWVIASGALSTLEGRLQARNWCFGLTRRQRTDFLSRCAAAADCSRASLEGAVVAAGLLPPPLEVLVAAASDGRLAVCRWLVEVLGCSVTVRLACLCLISAAGPGQGIVEEARAWLQGLAPSAGEETWSEEDWAKAASGDLVAVWIRLYSSTSRAKDPALYRVWRAAIDLVQARRDLEQPAAAGSWFRWARPSRTPEFYRGPHAAQAVARLAQTHPTSWSSSALEAAAESGHTEAVRFLLSRGVRPFLSSATSAAARNGHVGVLQALHEAGCIDDRNRCTCLREALEGGSLPMVEWLLATYGDWGLALVHPWTLRGAGDAWNALAFAASSGSVPLMRAMPGLLRPAGLGWGWGPHTWWPSAVASGCEEAVVWLAARAGVPKLWSWSTYDDAALQGDLRMAQRLHKLGFPYGDSAAPQLAETARRVPAAAAALPWLEEPGCPASWEAAAAAARPSEHAWEFVHSMIFLAFLVGLLHVLRVVPVDESRRLQVEAEVAALKRIAFWLGLLALYVRPVVGLAFALLMCRKAALACGPPSEPAQC